MLVDCRLLDEKVIFDAFPIPTIKHTFANFHNTKMFSVLDLNSAYCQIPLSAKSRNLRLFEFTKLPMEIMGCPVLSSVVNSLFGDRK
jgi:hypothetical protein